MSRKDYVKIAQALNALYAVAVKTESREEVLRAFGNCYMDISDVLQADCKRITRNEYFDSDEFYRAVYKESKR